MDVANGPVALNLQTAVDIAKSSRGIDEGLHQLARALQYKSHELRADRKNPHVYTQDRVFQVNTDEPTAWMAQAVNGAYGVTQLPRIEDKIAKAFGPLVQGEFEPEQARLAQRWCDHYYGLVAEQMQAQKTLAEQHPRALEQPSLWLTSAMTGKTIQVERLIDGLKGKPFDWRVEGQTDWQIAIRPDAQSSGFVVEQLQGLERQRLGWVNPVSAREAGLERALGQSSQLVINGPLATLKPPARLENDLDELRAKPQLYLEGVAQDLGAGEMKTLAAALWQTNIQRPGQSQARMGMNLAMRMFPEQVAEQLGSGPPPIYVSRASADVVLPEGGFVAQIQSVMEPNKAGQLVERQGLFVTQEEGRTTRLGLLAEGGIQLASNIAVKAELQETVTQAATVQVMTPRGEMGVTKVSLFDFGETPFEGQSARLQLQTSQDGIEVKVVDQEAGESKTLGRLGADTQAGRAAAWAFWREQGERPWESTLERKCYVKLELKIGGEARSAQPRSFGQALAQKQQGALLSPSYSQLQQWWQVAHAQQQPALQAELKLMGDGLVLAWQAQGNSTTPPPNFRSADVVLDPQQAGHMREALAWRQQQQPSYSPSYQELQGLWRLAGQAGESQLQGKVAALGQQLVAAFRYESRTEGKPGADYQCADVRLTVAEQRALYASPQPQRSTRNQGAGVGR